MDSLKKSPDNQNNGINNVNGTFWYTYCLHLTVYMLNNKKATSVQQLFALKQKQNSNKLTIELHLKHYL